MVLKMISPGCGLLASLMLFSLVFYLILISLGASHDGVNLNGCRADDNEIYIMAVTSYSLTSKNIHSALSFSCKLHTCLFISAKELFFLGAFVCLFAYLFVIAITPKLIKDIFIALIHPIQWTIAYPVGADRPAKRQKKTSCVSTG